MASGEAAVIAWCNQIRFNMARDPGRQTMEEQFQIGFDFIDSYLEEVFSNTHNEASGELLKTPGRKKAPARTRAATAAAAKVKSVIAMSLEDTDTEHENRAPVNSFHKALLQAREHESATKSTSHTSSSGTSLKTHKAVTIASSPTRDMEEDPVATASPHPPPPPSATKSSPDPLPRNSSAETVQHMLGVELEPETLSATPSGSLKELSMIAEDDESMERSRLSEHPPAHNNVSAGHEAHAARPRVKVVAPTSMDVDQPPQEDVTTTSTHTFDSIALDSPPRDRPLSSTPSDYFTAPLPQTQDEVNTTTVPLPIIPMQSEVSQPHSGELSVPIRDDSPAGHTLVRKPSLSQFAGLPAPSPLHKSTRALPEPSQGAGVTAGMAGGKRSSWLVKAREAKAMEFTGKRASALTPTLGVPGASDTTKRKSGEMLGAPTASPRAVDEGERPPKVQKLAEMAEAPSDAKGRENQVAVEPVQPAAKVEEDVRAARESHSPPPDLTVPVHAGDDEEGVLVRFKRTVEGLGARAGKSMGKSLGGTAAAALAEARAAAQARVAERHQVEGSPVHTADANPPPTPPRKERRLSVSDLISSAEKKKQSERMLMPAPPADTSVSTTPPHSPPPPVRNSTFTAPAVPVFSKPPVVFAPPPPAAPGPLAAPGAQPPRAAPAGPRVEFSFKLPTSHPFSLPTAMSLGVPAALPGSSSQPSALSAQTSKASLFSDAVFDQEDDVPAWMPETQDTDYSLHPSRPATQRDSLDDDDDDSWHVDENFKSNQMWTPFGFASADKDDTWSTLPSGSQRGGDTGPLQPTQNFTRMLTLSQEAEEDEGAEAQDAVRAAPLPRAFDTDAHSSEPEEADVADVAMEIDDDEQPEPASDLEDLVVSGKSTVSLVPQVETTRSQSQQSMASTSSSQSQPGFFGQASRLVSSVLGGSKKAKPEPVKSLQLAAAAAKKQQEEIEKKTARLKEMENRRQLAMQRKADEEAARILEEEKKIKEDAERRKREREEHTDKRPLRSTTKKAEEDTTKKRKMVVEVEKKPDTKKPPSKEKTGPPPRTAKPGSSAAPATVTKIGHPLKSALRQPGASVHAASASQDASAPAPSSSKPASKTLKSAASSSNLKNAQAATGKGKAPSKDEEEPRTQAAQSQMANRVKAPPVASESIELPDINSEYSDSDDEDRPRGFARPGWAQSPELRQALEQQSTMNPDEIFGRIGPLRMEEIFRTRQSRFRARTSSANWTGTDQLTADEEREYARRMGFR